MILTVSLIDNTGGEARIAKIWDSETGILIKEIDPKGDWMHGKPPQFSPDGRFVLVRSFLNAKLIEVGVDREDLRLQEGQVLDATLSPDGKKILAAFLDGTVRVFDIFKRLNLFQFQVVPKMQSNDIRPYYDAPVMVYFSPDGKEILTTSKKGRNKTAMFWDSTNGTFLAAMDIAWGKPEFSPGGEKLISTLVGLDISKVWLLDLIFPKTLKMLAYTSMIKNFMEDESIKVKDYKNYIEFLAKKSGKSKEEAVVTIEDSVFKNLHPTIQKYLERLIPGRL